MNNFLFKSTVVVGAMTMLSRILGLVRDIMIARLFPSGDVVDAFFLAFKLPNILRSLLSEGAFSLVFVPVLSEYRTRVHRAEIQDFINHATGTLGCILLALTILGVLAAPLLVGVSAPGFIAQPGKVDLAAGMLRITFPYIFFISMTALAAGILHTGKIFWVSAFSPALFNLILIACAVWLSPYFEIPIRALAWGIFIAGMVQLLFHLPFLYREGWLPKPVWGWRHAGVQKVIQLMIPTVFGASAVQISLLFDTIIASFLLSGSISWLYYSERLLYFPMGVFGIALATVVLPYLSEAHYGKSATFFAKILQWAMIWSLIIAIPAALGLFLLSKPILSTLFQYGEFTERDSMMTAYSLMAYSLGLPAVMLIKILADGFYAQQDSKTPVRIGIQAVLLNVALNVVFVVLMLKMGFIAPHAGLALATTVSAYFNVLVLAFKLKRQVVEVRFRSVLWPLLKIICASAVMSALVLALMPPSASWSEWLWYERVYRLSAIMVIALSVYCAQIWAMGLLGKLRNTVAV